MATAQAARRRLTLDDGRVIEFLDAGPPDGLPLVLHEGTPIGLVLYPPTVQPPAHRSGRHEPGSFGSMQPLARRGPGYGGTAGR